MVNAINSRKNWIIKFCSIIIGLAVTGAILFFLPKQNEVEKSIERPKPTERIEIKEREIPTRITSKEYKVIVVVKFKKSVSRESAEEIIKNGLSLLKSDSVEGISLMHIESSKNENE